MDNSQSDPSSQASEDSIRSLKGPECECDGSVRSNPIAALFSHTTGPESNVTRTSETSTDQQSQLTLSVGFPCQPVSVAGRAFAQEAICAAFWPEFTRVVGLLRPRYILVENVP